MATLAINGGKPVVDGKTSWPEWPQSTKRDEQRLLKTLRNDEWGIGSETNDEFAEAFAAYTGSKYILPVNSGTAALELIVKGLDIGPGDEAIVPAYTFIATATCALEIGATIVFADVDPDTWNIDVKDVARKITSKTRAIIPVHFAGSPADLVGLKRITKGKNIAIIEDAAHAHGMLYRGKASGHYGAAAEYSFQTTKNMSGGEGGALATNNKTLYEHALSCHSFGRKVGRPWYEHHRLSWNHRISALQSALLLGQLERLEKQTVTRHRNGAYLNEVLSQIPGIHPQREHETRNDTRRAYHLYMWRYDADEVGVSRERFLEALNAEGVPCSGGYPTPLQEAPMMLNRNFWHSHGVNGATGRRPKGEPDYSNVVTPGASQLCREGVWLIHPFLLAPKKQIRLIADAVAKIVDNADELRKRR